MTMLLDQHWYTSKVAVQRAMGLPLNGFPHLTPESKATLVCNFVGAGQVAMFVQNEDGHNLKTVDDRPVAFDVSELPDLERLVEFDHLPESRKATSWMKPGSKLA